MTKLGIRYYDPTLGRFTQPDPTGQDPHYTYAGNNPVNFTDPSGASCGLLCKAGAAAAAAAAGGIFGVAIWGVLSFTPAAPVAAIVGGAIGGCATGAYYQAFTGGDGQARLEACVLGLFGGGTGALVARAIRPITSLFGKGL